MFFGRFQIFWWGTRGVVWGRRRRLAEWLLMCLTVPRDEHHCTHSHYLWQVFLTTCDKYLSLLVTSISQELWQVFLTSCDKYFSLFFTSISNYVDCAVGPVDSLGGYSLMLMFDVVFILFFAFDTQLGLGIDAVLQFRRVSYGNQLSSLYIYG